MAKRTIPSPDDRFPFTEWWKRLQRKVGFRGYPGALIRKSVRIHQAHAVSVYNIVAVQFGHYGKEDGDFLELNLSYNQTLRWTERGQYKGWHINAGKIKPEEQIAIN